MSSAAIAASRPSGVSGSGPVAGPKADPIRGLSPDGGSPMKLVWPSNRRSAPIRAPAGNTRIEPSASRTRKPIARSSAKSSPPSLPPDVTRARYQTHGTLCRGDTSVTSAGSIVPVIRTSPAARLVMLEVAVSPSATAVRYPPIPLQSR